MVWLWVRCVTVNAFHLLASSDNLVKVKLLWLVGLWTNEEDAWCILAINRSLGKSVAVLHTITLNYTVQKVKKSRGLSNNAWDFRLLCDIWTAGLLLLVYLSALFHVVFVQAGKDKSGFWASVILLIITQNLAWMNYHFNSLESCQYKIF